MPPPPPHTKPTGHPQLRLADHVRATCVDGQVILLDLRRGRYIGAAACPELADAIEGWPVPPDASGRPAHPLQLSRWTAPLQAQGLVTDRPSVAIAPMKSLQAPARSLNADETVPHGAVGWRQWTRFHRSAASAALRLQCQSLATIAAAVIAQRPIHADADMAKTLVATQAAVTAYQRLRLFVFTAHNRCLHDALTLVTFLAAEGIAAHWVIGVRTRPFGAHAWAQIGDIVLNDQHEQVRRYAPILVA